MTKENTLSILENIRKKLNKLDAPKENKKIGDKNFADLGDEFEYIDPMKEEKIVETKKVETPTEPEKSKVDHDLILEHEIENSFPEDNFLNEENHKEPVKSQPEEPINLVEQKDLPQDSLEESDEFDHIEGASTEHDKDHEEDMFLDLDLDEEPVVEDSKEPEEVSSTKQDKDIEDELFGDHNEEEVQKNDEEASPLSDFLKTDVVEAPASQAPKKSDEEDLDELLAENDEKYLSKEKSQEDNLQDWADTQNAGKAQFQKAQDNDNKIDLATKSLLKQESLQKASESMKKLFDAKNTVSSINSFTKSENMSEIALQLLEPRLEKWLNENLPEIVERIVREEIGKIMPK